jgi:uncharacterized protein (TIGR01777 family)
MRVLIAGGTGMIGRALTKQFLKNDWEVTVLSRKARTSQNPNLKYLEWDSVNLGEWQDAINKVDAVINLSGESIGGSSFLNLRWTRKRKTCILQSRINAGRVLTEAIEKAESKPKAFIQASGVGFYGVKDQDLLTEDSPAGDDFLADVCQLWEASTEQIEKLGVRRAVVRFGVVISRENPIVGYMTLPFKMMIGGKLGSGKQYFTWIHIKDVVRIIGEMLENKKYKGTFNICAPSSSTNSEVSEVIAELLKRPNWFPTPAFLLKLALGDASTLVLDGQNVQPKKLIDLEYEYKYADLRAAFYDVLVKDKYLQIG